MVSVTREKRRRVSKAGLVSQSLFLLQGVVLLMASGEIHTDPFYTNGWVWPAATMVLLWADVAFFLYLGSTDHPAWPTGLSMLMMHIYMFTDTIIYRPNFKIHGTSVLLTARFTAAIVMAFIIMGHRAITSAWEEPPAYEETTSSPATSKQPPGSMSTSVPPRLLQSQSAQPRSRKVGPPTWTRSPPAWPK